MKAIKETLEFNQIQTIITNFCVSNMAKKMIVKLQPYNDKEDLTFNQEYIVQAMKVIYAYGNIPLASFDDIKPYLDKANKDGVLFGEDFVKIVIQLNNIKELDHYFNDNIIEESSLTELINQLYLPKELLQQINKCIDPTGYVLDSASHELQRIRRQIISIESSIRSRIDRIKSTNKDYLSNDAINSRNDHLVLPVKSGYKNQVKGIIHGHSASGQTMFIEPEEIVMMNNQLAGVKNDEQEEIHRILLELTKLVKSHYDVLNNNQEVLIHLDYIFAISNYGKKIDGIIPSINDNNNDLKILRARHPLIEKDKVVSNDIIINSPQDIMLISGSNTGGKTVVLKTVGLLSLMAICALPLPCKEATIPLFDQIWVSLGDEQSIEQSLSTFSSHMKRLIDITNNATNKTLVLIDEIGSGTDPKEGQSIAEAVLRYLHSINCLTIASTHYSSLKQYAKKEDYIKISAVEFDQENMKPTYRLIDGNVGNSYALEISSKLGLKPEIIENARMIKDNNLSESDRLLEKLQDELSLVQQEKDDLEALNNEANHKLNKYNNLINKFNEQKESLLEQAKKEANQLLEESKKQIDEVFNDLHSQNNLKPHEVIDAKRYLDLSKHQSKKVVVEQTHKFKIGDIVKVKSVNREGEVVDINKKGTLSISMGGLKINAETNDVEFLHVKAKPKKVKTNLKSLRKTTNQSYEINIIGKRYEEAMILVDKFLDDAIVNNYTMVRIVHGMGSGVLRNGVRKLLDKHKYVTSYRDGGPNEGGLGATLVYFE